MKKTKVKLWFVCSDIHGFFSEWMTCLLKKGFDINNSTHGLIILGDIFDRGNEALKVYEFIKKLPKNRRILIRGNHELLLNELVKRKFAYMYDRTNGTYNTLFNIAGYDTEDVFNTNYWKKMIEATTEEEKNNIFDERLLKIEKLFSGKITKILKWIFSDEWLNYYETSNYIFVHSFIPLQQSSLNEYEYEYKENWRDSTDEEWNEAMWGCPWKKAKLNFNQTKKTIVCGHWHTSDFFNNLSKSKHKKDITNNPIFKSKKYKLIGLDACTVVTHKVNILVLKDEEL